MFVEILLKPFGTWPEPLKVYTCNQMQPLVKSSCVVSHAVIDDCDLHLLNSLFELFTPKDCTGPKLSTPSPHSRLNTASVGHCARLCQPGYQARFWQVSRTWIEHVTHVGKRENYRPNLRENMSIVFCIPPKGLKWIEILWEISLPTLDLAIPTPKKIGESSRISPVETKLIGVDIIISLNWVVGIPNRYYIIKSKLIIKTNQRLYISFYADPSLSSSSSCSFWTAFLLREPPLALLIRRLASLTSASTGMSRVLASSMNPYISVATTSLMGHFDFESTSPKSSVAVGWW